MDAETLYHQIRAAVEALGDLFINDDADERLADAARVIAEDPRNEQA